MSDPEKIKQATEFTLTNTNLWDEVFPLLAPAANLEVLTLDSRKITGAGLNKLTCEKLRVLALPSTAASDGTLKDLRSFPQIAEHRSRWNQRHQRGLPKLSTA